MEPTQEDRPEVHVPKTVAGFDEPDVFLVFTEGETGHRVHTL